MIDNRPVPRLSYVPFLHTQLCANDDTQVLYYPHDANIFVRFQKQLNVQDLPFPLEFFHSGKYRENARLFLADHYPDLLEFVVEEKQESRKRRF